MSQPSDVRKRPFLGDFPLIFERSEPGRRGHALPANVFPAAGAEDLLPAEHRRAAPPLLPEVSEPEAVKHYTRLSQRNFSIDTNFYPLGSCTMKYNPRVNERVAAIPGFARAHPLQDASQVQGLLSVMGELSENLAAITGMAAVSLQPAAGAQGELTGLLVIRAWLDSRREEGRDEVLIPDSAHGTNPASVTIAGMRAVEVASNEGGGVDLDDLAAKLSPRTAAFMATIPSTLGLFDRQVPAISRMVHEAGGQVYMDGANLNALLGVVQPARLGVDVLHINLHKTFSTPHGGGGPGAGPIAVGAHLEPFLPFPRVVRKGNGWDLDHARPKSVGRVKGSQGNVGMHLRAWTYIRALGPEGLAEISRMAVLNANYLRALLAKDYEFPHEGPCMHECVATATPIKKATGIRALDIAKRLIDYGFHPPTIYFPLIVKEALMIEPTESEDRRTLETFARVLVTIKQEAELQPEVLLHAPHTTPVGRLDEVRAARQPVLRWYPPGTSSPLAAGSRAVDCAPCFA